MKVTARDGSEGLGFGLCLWARVEGSGFRVWALGL